MAKRGQHDANRTQKLKAAPHRDEAVNLRASGWTYAQIGEYLGMTEANAYQKVKRYMTQYRKVATERANVLLELELARLDKMTQALDTQIEAGNVQAIDRYLKIMERRTKLLGLDAPKAMKFVDDEGNAYAPVVYMPPKTRQGKNDGPGGKGKGAAADPQGDADE